MFNSIYHGAQMAKRHGDLFFAALLPEDRIRNAFGNAIEKVQSPIYPPGVLVWSFLSQVFSVDHGCRETVARLIAFRVAAGLPPCSAETGAYCIARDKLPEAACENLVEQTGGDISRAAPETWLWKGRRVRVADGTTCTMADTPENQAEYPQLDSQRPGCGFPIVRMVVLFCLATGLALKMALDKYAGKQTGEASLCRSLSAVLEPGNVLLGDRIFCGWFDVALQKQRGVEVVLRKHQGRKTDFRTGRRLGKEDHLITWNKPCRPEWMDQATYDSLPEFIIVRELRVRVATPGFRTKEVLVITTFEDPEQFTKDDLADLYRRRWQAELNLRSLKTVLQMDHLRCKKPHRVRNEIRMHLIGYNLLRGVMVEAAMQAGVQPWQLSFKGTQQTVNEFLRVLHGTQDLAAWSESLLACVASHRVGNRPDRIEPRVRKRRAKNYPLMNQPRHAYKTPNGEKS